MWERQKAGLIWEVACLSICVLVRDELSSALALFTTYTTWPCGDCLRCHWCAYLSCLNATALSLSNAHKDMKAFDDSMNNVYYNESNLKRNPTPSCNSGHLLCLHFFEQMLSFEIHWSATISKPPLRSCIVSSQAVQTALISQHMDRRSLKGSCCCHSNNSSKQNCCSICGVCH